MASPSGSTLRVLLMVTGGIAAYKSCFLARLLMQAGFSVKVAMTDAATHFVTPMTFQVLTGHPVATDLWGEGQSEALDHIEYARWADLTIIAPATANTMAKAAGGIADEIVTTLLLAFPGPVLMAPAMNDNMWRHPATQANRALLEERGVTLVGPGAGWLACGTVDEGRMAEPEEIVAVAKRMALSIPQDGNVAAASETPAVNGPWHGTKVVITAGPTHESIDAVRYLANRSSGAMGYALAAAAVKRGAEVTLVSGPVDLLPPRGLAGLELVASAQDMAQAVAKALDAGADWLIMAAAVADYTVAAVPGKLKKEDLGDVWQLPLHRNPDILADVANPRRDRGLTVVGFALETEQVLDRAAAKLQAKGMDFVVANDPTAPGSGFGSGNHQVTLLGEDGIIWASESLPKEILAGEIIERLGRAKTSE
jgi:phosphopantothenoylcysteine decarboxylase/phosphopantothenate--cysteine ligase